MVLEGNQKGHHPFCRLQILFRDTPSPNNTILYIIDRTQGNTTHHSIALQYIARQDKTIRTCIPYIPGTTYITYKQTYIPTYITLHYITCHAMPCHAMPCHAMPCHAIPFHSIPFHHTTPHHTTLHYITLHCITLHYITLHYITLHYITLHYITLHYITHTYRPFIIFITHVAYMKK